MCRHLTDFASARAPKISTCSLSNMTSLSTLYLMSRLVAAFSFCPVHTNAHPLVTFADPADLVSKLKFLFTAVLTLFMFMNFGALVGFYQDTAERRQQLRRLCQPGMGFHDRNGVWTWTLQQNELRHAVEAPSGSAVSIASEFGFPFLRLRLALPEELFAGSVAQSMGRKDGFSIQGLLNARDENVAVMKQLQRTMSCFSGPDPTARAQIPALLENADDTQKRRLSAPRAQALAAANIMPATRSPWAAAASGKLLNADMFDYDPLVSLADLYASPPDPRDLVGTALVFAFMANQKTLPVMELSARTEAARAYFADLRVAGIHHGFDSLYSKFLLMLGPDAGTLTARDKWMVTSRLWRFIFLQREDGGFDMTQSLAIALEAHEGEPPSRKASKWRKRFAVLGELCASAGDGGDLDDAADEAMSSDDSDSANADRPQYEAKKIKDCPISFSVAAVRRRMPSALLLLNDSYDHDPALRRAHSRLLSRRGSATAPSTPLSPYVASPHDSCSSQAHMLRRVDTEDSTIPVAAAAGFGDWEVAPDFSPPLACASARDLAAAEECAADDTASLVPVGRIWATSLSVAVLKGLDISWLLDDEAPEGEEQTIVDAAVKWLQAQGAADARVQVLLDSGELAAAADKAVSSWKKVMEHNISELRNTDVLSKFTAVTHVQHATGRVIKSIMTDHGALCINALLATLA